MSNTIQECTAVEARVALDRLGACQLIDVREFSKYEVERLAGQGFKDLRVTTAGFKDGRRPDSLERARVAT